jgi:cation:H+ antiporter
VLQDVIFILIGLAGLFFGGEWLVQGASRLARSYGISALVVGLTVVAFGTSVPELVVSLNAVLTNSSDISVGNVVGSNISNIGLILGLTAFIFPVMVHATLIRREAPFMIAATVVTLALFSDGKLSRFDGIVLLLGFVVFNYLMFTFTMADRKSGALAAEEAEIESGEEPIIAPEQRRAEVIRLLLGLVVLVVGARLTVDGAVNIARSAGISELAIGVTLVAVGTSLPELATSLVAALRKQNDIALGNVIGSNIFNLLLILGVTSTVHPLPVDPRVLGFDGPVMALFAVGLAPLVMTAGRISRGEAAALLVGYAAFTVLAFVL